MRGPSGEFRSPVNASSCPGFRMFTWRTLFRAVRGRRCLSLAAIAAVFPFAPRAQVSEEATALRAGQTLERELSGGQEHRYSLPLAAGEYASLVVEQRGIDVVIELHAADGKLVADFDAEPRRQGRESAGLIADSPMTCLLRIKARYPKDPLGRYSVHVAEVRPATEADRALFEAHKLATAALALSGAGKYDDALELDQRALALMEKTAEPNGAYTGFLLGRLGALYQSKGDYAKAGETYQRAIAIDEKAIGRQHPQTAISLGGLGVSYMNRDDYINAGPVLQEELGILESALGPEHPSLTGCLMSLSLLHQDLEELDRALPELQRALAIAEKTLAPDDFSLIALVHNLGNFYIAMRDYDRAVPLLERALAMVEKKFGPDHPYVVPPLQNLGTIARQRKQYDRALELLWRAEAVREKTIGKQTPQTASILINIANVYTSQGQYAKAIEFDGQARDILETAVGHYHSLTVMALGNIARTYTAHGDLPQAVDYQTRYDTALEKNIELNLALGSEREKLAYAGSITEHTDRTLSLCLIQAPGNPAACELAAAVILQRKGRVLDAMSGSLSALRQRLNPEDRKLLDDLSDTNARLAALALKPSAKPTGDEHRKQLAAIQAEQENLEAAIGGRSAEFRAQSQPVTLDAVRAAIPAEAALVEFAVYRPFDPKGENEESAYGAARYAAFVLRRQGKALWKDLGPVKEIDAAAAAFRQALRDPQMDARQAGPQLR